MPRSSSGSWPTLNRRTWVQAAWGLGVGDLFCLRRCCRCAGLQPHEDFARRALRPERAATIDAQHDAHGLERDLRAHEEQHKARGHVGRPGHREEPQFGAGPLAPGDGEAAIRDSAARGHRVRSPGGCGRSSSSPRVRMASGKRSALRSKIGSHQPPRT